LNATLKAFTDVNVYILQRGAVLNQKKQAEALRAVVMGLASFGPMWHTDITLCAKNGKCQMMEEMTRAAG